MQDSQGFDIQAFLQDTAASSQEPQGGGTASPPRTQSPKAGLLSFGRISDKEKAEFCMQLAVMLQAKVSLYRALHTIKEQQSPGRKKMRDVIEKLAADIERGCSFAEALSGHEAVFDRLFAVTAEVGQESGKLPEVFMHLAEHLEQMTALRRKFIQALTYPMVVLVVAAFSVLFLLIFIVPTFAEMFRSFQFELPLTTRVVLSLSDFMRSYWLIAGGVTTCVIFVSLKALHSTRGREALEAFALRVPFIGDVILKNHVARFCRTLGTQLQSQVSLLDALDVTERMITHKELKRDIGEIIRCVRRGTTVTEPVVRSRRFPPIVAQMIAVGEETSELDSMLIKVADYYEKELGTKAEMLSSVIEPVLILFLGVIVGGILVAMYLPMFDLINVVQGMQ